MDENWVSASDASNIVAKHYSNAAAPEEQARSAILVRLCSGALPCWAQLQVYSPPSPGSPKRVHDSEVPADFWITWENMYRWHRDDLRADWEAGDFTIDCLQDEPWSQMAVFGVRFYRRLLPGEPLSALSTQPTMPTILYPPTRDKKGGAPLRWDWEGMWAALVAEANGIDGLDDTRVQTASAIAKLMQDHFIDRYGEAPSDSELRKRGSMLRKALADNHDGRSYRQLSSDISKRKSD